MTNENLILLNRVPHLIVLYWIIKIAATTLGETGADMFSFALDLGYLTTILIFMLVFILFLGIKLSIKGYHPVMYWMTFTASAIAGTAISDFLDRTLGFGYLLGSAILIVLLLITLYAWYKKEGSIAVDNILTFQAEIYYWISFLIANTLGTAMGDYIADDIGLGFLNSAIFIGITLSIIALLHYFSNISKIVLFWFAFVLTRPFGASFGDLLTKPDVQGGLGFGTIGASLFFVIVLIIALHRETILERSRKGILPQI